MRIIEFDQKKGFFSVAVENLDDLWHIYNLISKDDVVYAKTTREIKVRGEAGRPVKGRRILLTLGLKVVELFFDKNLSRVRLRGVIVDAPEKYEDLLGSYHTISVQLNTTLKVFKQKLTNSDIKRIKEACEVKTKPIIVVSLDDEEACVAVIRRFKVDVKFEQKIKLPGKLEAEKRGESLKAYFAEVSKNLLEVLKVEDGFVSVVGPGFLKDDFSKYLEEKFGLKVYVGFASSGGLAGVNEAVRSGVLLNLVKEGRLLEEAQLVEKFFAKLAHNEGKAIYGIDEVEDAANAGAIEELLIVDEWLRRALNEERLKVEKIIHVTENKKGKIHILSESSEAGEKILSLGGIVAILRFPFKSGKT
ncbi:MAG: mRNA surveillance protein pelota [Candidatus Bathyarchaeota archaeon]|nr:mRNA surveillance protein pelota [Candidatus Bathyarchaeota archaeon]